MSKKKRASRRQLGKKKKELNRSEASKRERSVKEGGSVCVAHSLNVQSQGDESRYKPQWVVNRRGSKEKGKGEGATVPKTMRETHLSHFRREEFERNIAPGGDGFFDV